MSLRRLASETAIYGLSSILGRALYFLLTPFYTALFTEFEYGIQADVFALVGFLLVLSTLRLDVAYFRFSKQGESASLLGTSWLTTAGLGVFFGLGLLVFSPALAEWSGYPAYQWLYALAGGILFFDALVELPLAKLRLEQRPWRFAAVRLTGILVNLGLNLFWLYLLPRWPEAPEWLQANAAGITYIFLANLGSSALVFLLLLPELRGMEWRIDRPLLRRLLGFSLPLVVVGFSYIINELLDRKLLPMLWPGGQEEGLELLGVYSANYKLAMLLALFTQAFRYGAEPFFFRESGQKDAQAKYARLARYYLLAALIGFLVVSLGLPAFSQVFLRAPAYRLGSDVVPILLLANLCLGLYYNLAVWYKVTDKTRYGAYISLGGAALTIGLNVLLIPTFGFYGCAWATLACYASMVAVAWWMGRRHYPIPYAWQAMLGYTALALILFGVYWSVSPHFSIAPLTLAVEGSTDVLLWAKHLGFSGSLLLFFLVVVALVERRALRPVAT